MGRYRAPGVYATEEVTSIAPSPIPNADVIAIVSEVPASAPFAESVTLEGTDEVQLQKEGVITNSVRIFSRDGSVEYDAGDDFTVTSSDTDDYGSTKTVERIVNSETDEPMTFSSSTRTYKPLNGRGVHDIVVTTATGGSGGGARTYQEFLDYTYTAFSNTLHVLPGGSIPTDGTQVLLDYKYGIEDGELVEVRYSYADEEYYGKHLFNDETEIYAVFGPPFKEDGTPNPMSLGAWLAFTNGGPNTQILAVPVNPHIEFPNRTVATQHEWQEAFDSIVEHEVALVVETSGTFAAHQLALAHVLGASSNNQERHAILGRDGWSEPGLDKVTLRGITRAINSKRIVVISPSKWETVDVTGKSVNLGAQFAACALAGKLTLFNPQDTMTRRTIVNIRTKGQEAQGTMNEDAFAGLCVIENLSGFMRVRHSITTMFADINQRELNVVRAQDFMIKSMREVLDRTVIGMLMEPDVDFLVQGAVTNILDRMKNSYVIADYGAPQVFQDANDPTRLRVRFEYRPNYAVNEISLEFRISPFGTQANVG